MRSSSSDQGDGFEDESSLSTLLSSSEEQTRDEGGQVTVQSSRKGKYDRKGKQRGKYKKTHFSGVAFQRLLAEVVGSLGNGKYRVTPDAVKLLHHEAEQVVMMLFEDANFVTQASRRRLVTARDAWVASRIRSDTAEEHP